jgi:hypothetical protein
MTEISFLPKEVLNVIRLVNFRDFKDLETFPRYPENLDVTLTLAELSIERYNRSLIIFISHCWLRGWHGAVGWDGKNHPDNAEGGKYKLCVRGIDKILKSMAPGMEECFLWFDYGCLDQNGNPALELKSLLHDIVRVSDCIFTPIFDQNHQDWDMPLKVHNLIEQFPSQQWNGDSYSYRNRGWCRVEMFYAASIPLLAESETEVRRNRMTAGLAIHRENGRRPQFLYSSKQEFLTHPPVVLPPLLYYYLDQYHPEQGNFTEENDRAVIKRLVSELRPYMKEVIEGYQGETINGRKNGWGIYQWPDGGVYEGEWKDDNRHGQGKQTYADGRLYEGEWKDGKRHGKGKFRFATGYCYEGEFKDDYYNGKGTARNFEGDLFDGEFKDGRMNGRGIARYIDGRIYEGQYRDDKMDGDGSVRLPNGEVYVGEFKDNKFKTGFVQYPDGRSAFVFVKK